MKSRDHKKKRARIGEPVSSEPNQHGAGSAQRASLSVRRAKQGSLAHAHTPTHAQTVSNCSSAVALSNGGTFMLASLLMNLATAS